MAQHLSSYMLYFSDGKDTQDLIITHISLLWGSALPCLLFPYYRITEIMFSGAIFLGISDSFASIVGSRWGKTPFMKGFKSWEGLYAFVASSVISFGSILYFYGELGVYNLFICFIVSVIVGFIEAFNRSIDNFVLPYAGYLLLKGALV